MSIEPKTGHIKAWVGGIDYRYFKYDNVSQSRRQVGSIFKPFVYATALRHGMSRCSELPNQRICVEMPGDQPDWCPDNSDFEYGEVVNLEYALANSMNTISAKLIKGFGPERGDSIGACAGNRKRNSGGSIHCVGCRTTHTQRNHRRQCGFGQRRCAHIPHHHCSD